MALFDALHGWLTDGGPLDRLYWQRLPEKQTEDVLVSAVTAAGAGADHYLGRADYANPKDGIEHDSGVLWFHTGLTFEARAKDPGEKGAVLATSALDRVRDRMLMLRDRGRTLPEDTSVPPYKDWTDRYGRDAEQETLFWTEVTNPPYLLEQDSRKRPVIQLLMEVRHKPVR